MQQTIAFTLNGEKKSISVDGERILLWVLRDDLGLTGTKFGCGESFCGACTVLVNGEAVRSCSVAVKEIAGKRVVTIEGLAEKGELHPVQEAFLTHAAYQCGFCTPGMILNACSLLSKTPHPTPAQIVEQMDDNLCRCGAHVRIVAAIEDAAGVLARRAK